MTTITRPSIECLVNSRNVYGTETFYPVSLTAKLFADVAGTKTLTPTVLNLIKAAGYNVKILTPDVNPTLGGMLGFPPDAD
jgi:hypothetical protein